jgi:AAA domain
MTINADVDAELARIRRERLAREAKLAGNGAYRHHNHPSGHSWRDGLISAADLQSKQFPPIRIVIPAIITEGVTLFAGKPKVGKSWWAFDCCIAVAGGRFVLGDIKPVQGDVLYLALEDNQRRLRRRLAKIMPGEAKWPGRLSLHTEWRRVSEGGLADIEAWCGTVKQPRLVWIDVLAKIRPLTVRSREQAFAADYAALEGLQQLAGRLSLAIVVNCHLRKMASDDEPADDVSGTLGLTAAADATAVLKRTQGAFTLYLRGRDTEETELAAEFDKSSCRWRLLGNASEIFRSKERQQIIAVLKDGPMSVSQIMAATERTDRHAITSLLFKMRKDGEVVAAGRGFYALRDGDPLNPVDVVDKGPFGSEKDNETSDNFAVSAQDQHQRKHQQKINGPRSVDVPVDEAGTSKSLADKVDTCQHQQINDINGVEHVGALDPRDPGPIPECLLRAPKLARLPALGPFGDNLDDLK